MDMSSLSSVPSPAHQPEAPKPSIVPPRERKKRGPARWLIPLVLILILGGLAWWKFRPSAKTGGPVIAVPVVSVTAGDIQKVVRVTGTVAARNFASLLAPRVLGSRSNVNRGGMGGALAGGASDFNLVLLHLIKAGAHVKKDEVVAQFDPTNQLLRLDDYKDAVIQTNNSIRKLIANLAANKEAHDQTVRAAKAGWDQAALDLRKAPVQAAIDAENAKLTAEQNEARGGIASRHHPRLRTHQRPDGHRAPARRRQRQTHGDAQPHGRHRRHGQHHPQRRVGPGA
jgi:hypothetical protein